MSASRFISTVAATVKCSVCGIPQPLVAPRHHCNNPLHPRDYMFMSQLIILAKILKPNPTFTQTSS